MQCSRCEEQLPQTLLLKQWVFMWLTSQSSTLWLFFTKAWDLKYYLDPNHSFCKKRPGGSWGTKSLSADCTVPLWGRNWCTIGASPRGDKTWALTRLSTGVYTSVAQNAGAFPHGNSLSCSCLGIFIHQYGAVTVVWGAASGPVAVTIERLAMSCTCPGYVLAPAHSTLHLSRALPAGGPGLRCGCGWALPQSPFKSWRWTACAFDLHQHSHTQLIKTRSAKAVGTCYLL